jgi:hypothetical protein
MRSLVLATALIALPVAAVTLVPLNDAELSGHATTIVVATVMQANASTLDPDGDGVGQPWTTVLARVDEAVKGEYQVGETLRFVQMGGVANGRTLRLDGMPEFAAGEKVLLVLNDRLLDPKYTPLVGWAQGVWRVRTVDGIAFAKRDFAGCCWMAADGGAVQGPSTAEEPLQAVTARLAQEVR